jgi:hypothetical protein
MGMGARVICYNADCFYTRDFFLGSGMSHYNLENCIDGLHYKTREKVKIIIQPHSVDDFYFELVLFHCQDCDHLFGRPMLKILFSNGEIFETHKNCGKCKSKNTSLQDLDDIEKRKCPKCKNLSLRSEGMILWD